VLEVMVLARLAGCKPGQIPLDVVPLFETIDDLGMPIQHAPLVALPAYAEPGPAAARRRPSMVSKSGTHVERDLAGLGIPPGGPAPSPPAR